MSRLCLKPPSQNDPWLWQMAQPQDINDMCDLTRGHFKLEMDHIVQTNEAVYRYALDQAMTHQRHNLAHEQLLVCRDRVTHDLLAYAWIGRGNRTPYSTDELAEGKMLHLRLTLPTLTRIRLVTQALWYWYTWAQACGIPVLVSNSIRTDQQTFLRLHERLGFTVRGGMAYMRLAPATQP